MRKIIKVCNVEEVMIIQLEAETKSKKIGARVTPEQKDVVIKLMKESGYEYESEYVLACCLKGPGVKLFSGYQEQLLERSDPARIECRTTKKEKEIILNRFKESKINNFGRFVRNCCLNNPIIVIDDLKEYTTELNRIGNNLNQLTMLCHQGLITAPDLNEVKEALKTLYQEVVSIKLKHRLKR
jgi:hypothetical protein